MGYCVTNNDIITEHIPGFLIPPKMFTESVISRDNLKQCNSTKSDYKLEKPEISLPRFKHDNFYGVAEAHLVV